MSETLLLSCSKEAFLIGTIENALNGVEVDIDSIPESYFKVDIKIVGDEFHSSIDGTVARSLWEFEKSLRNATVQMLHGNSNSNCLTFEEKSYTSINFTVSAGCSNLKADLKPLIKSLGRGFEKNGYLRKNLRRWNAMRHRLIWGLFVRRTRRENGRARNKCG